MQRWTEEDVITALWFLFLTLIVVAAALGVE